MNHSSAQSDGYGQYSAETIYILNVSVPNTKHRGPDTHMFDSIIMFRN